MTLRSWKKTVAIAVGEKPRNTTYERELTESTAQELQRDLVEAKSQLAGLMNLAPGTDFSLAVSSRPPTPPQLSMPLETMIELAVRDRAELREVAYQQRISAQEVHAALLEMLPGLQLYAAPNWDTNSFLLNSNWVGWGAKASWNLLKVFQYPAKRGVIETQDELLAARMLATAMAVMTQVHEPHSHHFAGAQAVDNIVRAGGCSIKSDQTQAGRVEQCRCV